MPSPREVLLENLPLIERIVTSICRRKGMCADEIDEFSAIVKLRLIEHDYAVIRAFKERSSFATYIAAVVGRVLLDYRNHEWGKWRPSAEVERMGDVAIELEKLLYRDECSLDEAFAKLTHTHPRVSRDEVDDLAARIPSRVRRRMVDIGEAASQPASEDADAAQIESAQRISAIVSRCIQRLHDDDQLLLKLEELVGRCKDAHARIAGIDNGTITLTAKANLLQVSVDAATMQLAYRSFRFPAKSDYSDDEIRILPDGSGLLLPSLPHAEGTGLARSVRSFRIDIPASWLSRRNASAIAASAVRTSHRTLHVARDLWASETGCDYVPGGSVTVDNQTTDYPGYWECTTYYWYEPDPVPSDPVGGGTSGATTGPPTASQSQTLSSGSQLAQDRLCNDQNCAQLFEQLGSNGVDMMNGTNYLDGRSTTTCMQHPDWAAWTTVGDCNVYLCDAFTTLSQSGAATILIHEALHDAGMSENPPDPSALTSSQINDLVQSNCDLTW